MTSSNKHQQRKLAAYLPLFLFATLLLGANATQSSSCANSISWSESLAPPTGLKEFSLSYPDTYNVQVNYYAATNNNVSVVVSGCSDDSNSALGSLIMSLIDGVDSVMLSVNTNTATTVAPQDISPVNPAGRVLPSPLTLLAVFLAMMYVFPKNRLSAMFVVIFVIGVLSSANVIRASSGTTVTINVYLPAQFTTVCKNNVCTAWGTAATSAGTTAAPSSTGATQASTSAAPGSTGSGSTSGAVTSAPTTAPTNPPTTTTTTTTTPAPTTESPAQILANATIRFNIRVLIMARSPLANYNSGGSSIPVPIGASFAAASFDSVGTPYDYVVVNATTNLAARLSTSGVGVYSAIVTIDVKLLSAAQKALVVAYQNKYGVRWAVVGSSPSGMSGVTVGAAMKAYNLTLAAGWASKAPSMNPNVRVNNTYVINWSGYTGVPAVLTPATITDPSTVTPVIMATANTVGATSYVAAAVFLQADGTEQLHYFADQSSDYIHSMVFHPVLVSWLSPAGLFIGARRLTLAVQPDDLFLASYVWDVATHTNPTDANAATFRMDGDDLQALADFFDDLNTNKLPAGSHITVEWPVNFGGRDDWVLKGGVDTLWEKAVQIQDKFYYLSHTWDHPCTLDNVTAATYPVMNSEVGQNINYTKNFFTADGSMRLWSNNSMITPCVTGLYNPAVLKAMLDLGVTGCVSDESVDSSKDVGYEPYKAYHGQWSTTARNGIEGMYFVPRITLDIDYDATNVAMIVDQYNTQFKDKSTPNLNFEEIMAVQTMYAVQFKVGFRHDPIMMHQANGASFSYNDPFTGTTHTVSLISLFSGRVALEMTSYFNLPIYQPQMDKLVDMFKQRDYMDACGIDATVYADADKTVVGVSTTGKNTCQMSLSGATLTAADSVSAATMESVGVETTAWINLQANQAQTFLLKTPTKL